MAYIYNLTDTWNAAGTAFTAISMDVTDTASASGSKVISLKVNGTELLGLDKTGKLGIGVSSVAGGTVQISGQTSNTNGLGLDQGQLLITDTDNSATSALMIGYRFEAGVDEYARIQARNGVGSVPISLQPGGGRVGIGTSGPNASSVLELASTTMGFLPPRMTTAQRDAISSPANGLVLYNSSTNKLQVRAAGAWVDLH